RYSVLRTQYSALRRFPKVLPCPRLAGRAAILTLPAGSAYSTPPRAPALAFKEEAVELRHKTILVTGGAGFLGRHLVARLQQHGCTNLVVPRSRDYDLTHEHAIRRLFAEHRPQVVLHLAAQVGGIGANRRN